MSKNDKPTSDKKERGNQIGYLKFVYDDEHYVYDETTNACIPLSGPVALILDDFLKHGAEAVRQQYADQMAEQELTSSLVFLQELQCCHGMFRPAQTIRLSELLSTAEFEKILKSPCRHLNLNITEQCNLRCNYCVYSGDFPSERSHGGQRMTWPIAQKSIDHLLCRSQDHIQQRLSFYGGEPLLHWNLVKRCIEYAHLSDKGRRLKIAISTNLTLLTDEMAAFVVEKGVHLNVSLDGPKPIHDSARILPSGNGTYEQVVRRVERLIRLDPEYCKNRLSILCTVAPHEDISALIRFFSQSPFTDLQVEPHPQRAPEGTVPGSVPSASSFWQDKLSILIDEYLESLHAHKPFNYRMFQGFFPAVFGRIAQRTLQGSSEEEVIKRLCIPSVNGIFVSSDGRFFPCENFTHPENCIGDNETGVDVARVRALLAFYTDYHEEACQNCWAARLCSLCFLHSLYQGKMSKQKMQKSCAQERSNIAQAFKWFLYLWKNEPEFFHDNELSLHSAVRQT